MTTPGPMRREIALLRDVVTCLDAWLDARKTRMASKEFIEAETQLVRAGWAYRIARAESDARLRRHDRG
jgi:hypothetical protein